MPGPDVNCYRRAMLLAARYHKAVEDFGLAGVCLANQQSATPATAFPPALFEFTTRLNAKSYFVQEDIFGANVRELTDQGFKRAEAELILAALEITS
jgi:hypothetical protein